jgi:hypothetical protein
MWHLNLPNFGRRRYHSPIPAARLKNVAQRFADGAICYVAEQANKVVGFIGSRKMVLTKMKLGVITYSGRRIAWRWTLLGRLQGSAFTCRPCIHLGFAANSPPEAALQAFREPKPV